MLILLDKINAQVWGAGLVSLILLTGLMYTIKLKAVQLHMLPDIISWIKSRPKEKRAAQLRTVSMALGTSMGTGNIIGVASALSLGGAGAVFWMWVSAFLGMAVVYAENKLSSVFSSVDAKGPLGYIKNGLGCPVIALFFAVMCIGAAFSMGGMVQVNSVTSAAGQQSGRIRLIIAALSFILIFSVISGGAGRIGSAAKALLPAAAAVYTLCCLAVLFMFREKLPEVTASVFKEAFSFRSAAGGAAGHALSVGIRRGIFSNEAGLGSSPLIHSSAEEQDTSIQSCFAMLEVFIDTIFCCTLTSLTILCSSPDGTAAGAFKLILGKYTGSTMTVILAVFSFCTVIGWYYCGETAFLYITKKDKSRLFPVVFAGIVSVGAVMSADTVWVLSDIFNGLMAFPNIAALLLLRKNVRKE
ncbi:MAG TPA: amino acid carrier protein [Ruminococcus sp.]|nr:amino acid carrier protein [Ruminococcus sp.]